MPSKNRKRKVDATGRNTGQKFVQLHDWMLTSGAYRLLSPQARALLVEMMRLYNGGNNGTIFMSQRDAAKALGIKTHATAAEYLRELQHRGFIKVVVYGSFSVKTQLASVYELTMFDVGSRKATKEFMSLPLSCDEEARVKNLTPSWGQRKPGGLNFLPDCALSGLES